MGLKDIDGVGEGSSRGSPSNRRSGSSSDNKEDGEERVVFHSDKGTKEFPPERWDEVKEVIRKEMDYTVSQVHNMNAEKRHDVLHEAATWSELDDPTESEHYASKRCDECGNSVASGYVVIEGRKFCFDHTAGQLAVYFRDDDDADWDIKMEY